MRGKITTAFSTFVCRLGVRRQGVEQAPRTLRSMYVTGSYFTTLGVRAFTGRIITADDGPPHRQW